MNFLESIKIEKSSGGKIPRDSYHVSQMAGLLTAVEGTVVRRLSTFFLVRAFFMFHGGLVLDVCIFKKSQSGNVESMNTDNGIMNSESSTF